jgi:hypothetical protein
VLPIGRGAVRERLLDLRDSGRVVRKKVGGRAVVWWRTDQGEYDAPDGEAFRDDPVFDLPMFASGASDVSATVDQYVADSITGESDPER